MIEFTVRDYLKDRLNVPVYLELPKDHGDSYVLIEKTGSSRQDWINHATFAIQSIAPRLANAILLNEEVKEVMNSMTSLPEVSRVALNSDYNFTDQEKKIPRYQAVYNLVFLTL